jgi:hypothetical protein
MGSSHSPLEYGRTYFADPRVLPRIKTLVAASALISIETPAKARICKPHDARRAARARFAKLELGVDPGAERAKAKAAAEAARLTLALVSDRYLETRKPVVRPATYAAKTRDLKLPWAPLRKRPIESIKRPDIARGSGRAAAKRARVSLSAMYSWAMGEGLCEVNPVIARSRKPLAPHGRTIHWVISPRT